uniref:Capsid protein n=1 Tax=Red panda feces-associated circular DNA virus 18 TaxID=2863971 RepID=A0A8K1HKD1_9VIRU|nr:capsid protein [Red panda feces-associated circular DNA virus 18]
MYGKRRYSKRRTTRRSSYRTRTSARRTYKKVGRSFVRKPRFALTGYARNTEKKFFDKTFEGNSDKNATGDTTPLRNNGWMWSSTSWTATSFANTGDNPATSNDLTKGLGTGTTARTRIGNKVKGCWIKGSITFTAARNIGTSGQGEVIHDQGGEVFADDDIFTEENYLRTTIRFVIVKDNQVNSVDTYINWDQVFDSTEKTAGVHSQPNIENMGRFTILDDRKFDLYANKPQKTLDFSVSGSSIGNIRYNGPSAQSLTDRGIYIIWAAYSSGLNLQGKDIDLAGPTGQSRLCFTDD